VGEVFAGFVIGFAIALIASPIAAWMIISSNDRSGVAQRIAPPGTSVIALAVVLNLASVLMFTAVGMVLGMALAGVEDRRPDGGIGSPNLVYTLIVVALTAVVAIPMLAVRVLRRGAIAGALVFATLFGWAMPWLATLRD
jgi:hypothetical protein